MVSFGWVLTAMGEPFTFRELNKQQFPLVNRFYKENGHKGKARGGERVFTLTVNGSIQAALRACPDADGYLLRGVWVAISQRNQGLGSALLKNVLTVLSPKPCWCFPYGHLKAFYQRAGFSEPKATEVPTAINTRYQGYKVKQPGLLVMSHCTPQEANFS